MCGYSGGKAADNLTSTGLDVDDWHENDGVVPTISQSHPFVCSACQERGRRRRRRGTQRSGFASASVHAASADFTKRTRAVDPPPAHDDLLVKRERPSVVPMVPAGGEAASSSSSPSPSLRCFHCTLTIDVAGRGSAKAGVAHAVVESDWECGVRRPSVDDGCAPRPLLGALSTSTSPPSVSESRGAWVSFDVADVTHVGLVLQPPSLAFQHAFFRHLWARIDAIDRYVDSQRVLQQ